MIEETSTSSLQYFRTPDGALIARRNGSDWRYYHYDELGSTRLLTDSSGNVTDTYSYDPWGNITSHIGSTNDNPYLYIGALGYYTHYQDSEFGLLHLGFRFYDPKIGRFTQQDPIGDGLNWYEYVEGNPLAWADPYGLGIIDLIQTGLDVAGCAPVIGEAADCANGLICLARRDYVGAGLSFTSMIPVVGDAIGKGGKVTRKVVQKVAKKTGKVAKVAKASKVYKAFKASNFRHNLGVLTKGMRAGMQAHHVLPQALEKQFLDLFPKININDPKFGAWVDSNHQKWSKAYENDWREFLGSNPSWSQVKGFARKMGKEYGFGIHF
jgi:RHS repeat-associated protein